jgi:hypothetical protein
MKDSDLHRSIKHDCPYVDSEIERLIAGGLSVADPAALAELPNLQREDFADPCRAEIVEAIRAHVKNGWPVELPAIQATLKDRGWPAIAHELALTFDCWTFLDSKEVSFYAKRLRLLRCPRGLREKLGAAWAAISDDRINLKERVQFASRSVPPALTEAQAAMDSLRGYERG